MERTRAAGSLRGGAHDALRWRVMLTTSMSFSLKKRMTRRVHNFNAGPGALPLAVLERARQELLNFQGCGMSVMEMSHRSKEFEGILRSEEHTSELQSRLHLVCRLLLEK